ncbi:MAG: protein kinase [Aequorivita sp.]
MTPKTIANYKILKELGTGGMGTVFLAENISISTKVAIKMLHPHLVKSEDLKTRFLKEARTQAILDYPYITKVIDFVSNEQGLFIILEFVEGEPLNDFLFQTKGLLPEKEANQYMVKILDAVGYAHSKGVVHRDLKSANIMVTPNKGIKIMDFGIAKLANDSMSLTKTGSRMGSPLYMSPEQVTGEKVDFRSDIYSLGVVYHEMLTGTPVYDQNNTSEFEIYNKIVKESLPRLKEFYKMNSDKAQEIVDIATAKLPAARFQSCEEFKNSLVMPAKVSLPKIQKPTPQPPEIPKPIPLEKPVVKKTFKENPRLIWLLALLILLIGWGGGTYYFMGNKEESSNDLTTTIQLAENQERDGNNKDAYHTYRQLFISYPDNPIVVQKLRQLESASDNFQKRSVESVLQLYLQTSSLRNFDVSDSILAYKILTSYQHIHNELEKLKENPQVAGEPRVLDEVISNLRNAHNYFRNSQSPPSIVTEVTVGDQFRNESVLQQEPQTKNFKSNRTSALSFYSVQIPPILPGCENLVAESQRSCFDEKIKQYLSQRIRATNFRYLNLKPGIQNCRYSFIVGADGSVSNVKVQAPHSSIEKELRGTLQLLADLKPGFQDYQPVAVSYSGDYTFEIKGANPDRFEASKEKIDKVDISKISNSPTPKNISMEMADRAPAFPGCESQSGIDLVRCTSSEINNFINRNLDYKLLSRAGLSKGEQRVFIKFRISEAGNVQNIAVSAGANHQLLVEEVTRVINTLPKMKGGIYNSNPVIIDYNVGLVVKIK